MSVTAFVAARKKITVPASVAPIASRSEAPGQGPQYAATLGYLFSFILSFNAWLSGRSAQSMSFHG